MEPKLALVIPAFKPDHLDAALRSIAAQTSKAFRLYVGIDGSPHDLESVLAGYADRIPMEVVRFPTNLGGTDLVGQWQRCIDLTRGEPWIWLFSDDDEMDPTCVERFLQESERDSSPDLFHFNLDVIDERGQWLATPAPFPPHLSSPDYYLRRMGSFVVEFVFRREAFDRLGRFVEFDLAWNADHATWIRLSQRQGIRTIEGPKVRWRLGRSNISGDLSSRATCLCKCNADLEFDRWARAFYAAHGQAFPGTPGQNLRFYQKVLNQHSRTLGLREILGLLDRYQQGAGLGRQWRARLRMCLYYLYARMKHG